MTINKNDNRLFVLSLFNFMKIEILLNFEKNDKITKIKNYQKFKNVEKKFLEH